MEEVQQNFNLDALLTINYDYKFLRQVLEYLLQKDKSNSAKFAKMGNDISLIQKEQQDIKPYFL